jgi:hypothetical protein
MVDNNGITSLSAHFHDLAWGGELRQNISQRPTPKFTGQLKVLSAALNGEALTVQVFDLTID